MAAPPRGGIVSASRESAKAALKTAAITATVRQRMRPRRHSERKICSGAHARACLSWMLHHTVGKNTVHSIGQEESHALGNGNHAFVHRLGGVGGTGAGAGNSAL